MSAPTSSVTDTLDSLTVAAKQADHVTLEHLTQAFGHRGYGPFLIGQPFIRIAALLCILLAITVPPLEIVPFASTAPMSAIAAFGLSITVRDGALMLGAVLLSLLTVAIGAGLWA